MGLKEILEKLESMWPEPNEAQRRITLALEYHISAQRRIDRRISTLENAIVSRFVSDNFIERED